MPSRVKSFSRYAILAACGGSAFLDLYATQPLLPLFRAQFGANEAEAGSTVSAVALACALAAPFAGPFADAVGRKRVIVCALLLLAFTTFAASGVSSLSALIGWRFAQGLLIPAVLSVTLAYIAEEFPSDSAGRAVGVYIAGNVLGGFLGRYTSALVSARWNWQAAFVALGWMILMGALLVLLILPKARNFRSRRSLREALVAMASFVRDPVLVSIDVVGGCAVFSLIAGLTFAMYHLAAPPFSLGTRELGNVFFIYIVGIIVTPLSGSLIDHIGYRAVVLLGIALGMLGMLIALISSLFYVIAGLMLLSVGIFAAQAASQGLVGVVAYERRSSAAALYLCVYYLGVALSAVAPAPVWNYGGWPAVVVFILAVQAVAAGIALTMWPRR